MLWRCFKHQTRGFYIDVGAENPSLDSVTKLFYDSGWQGINIEPQPQLHLQFERERTRDININAAISLSDEPNLSFYSTETGIGLAGFGEAVRQNILDANQVPVTINVPVLTLDQVVQEHCISNIDFLKVDVEGHELSVLRSFSFKPRPRVICIEVTQPNSHQRRNDNSEINALLISHQYTHVYFDGLNDWWLAAESETQYIANFSLPPNCLDSISPSSISAHERIAKEALLDLNQSKQVIEKLTTINNQLLASNASLQSTNQELLTTQHELSNSQQELQQQQQQLSQQLVAIESSLSWRITAPLRHLRAPRKIRDGLN